MAVFQNISPFWLTFFHLPIHRAPQLSSPQGLSASTTTTSTSVGTLEGIILLLHRTDTSLFLLSVEFKPPHTNPKVCDNLVYLVIIFSIILCLILIFSPPLIETTDGSGGTDPASQRRAAASSGVKSCAKINTWKTKTAEDLFFKEVASRWWLLRSCEFGTSAAL